MKVAKIIDAIKLPANMVESLFREVPPAHRIMKMYRNADESSKKLMSVRFPANPEDVYSCFSNREMDADYSWRIDYLRNQSPQHRIYDNNNIKMMEAKPAIYLGTADDVYIHGKINTEREFGKCAADFEIFAMPTISSRLLILTLCMPLKSDTNKMPYLIDLRFLTETMNQPSTSSKKAKRNARYVLNRRLEMIPKKNYTLSGK